MKIDRLRLIGFKSFVEPTELLVERGLTGVVGPNGCGKSNLLEALRWVMGETSYKSMRAAAMDDVIFSGTNQRPARNNAEVTLFLDNAERSAPSEYNDCETIEITRRIEREAGSAYRINGRDARARDVKVLFEDAATGARSPALVRQGQISDIVNAKPEQRRRVLEDAAGIAGLHTRRHEAELRLRAATANLERLQDVIAQLNTQVESLKRQARQAKRYKEISAAIRTTEALSFHLAWQASEARVAAGEHDLAEALSQLAAVTQAESQIAREDDQVAEAEAPLRHHEAEAAAALNRVRLQAESFEAEAERAARRAAELDERIGQLNSDIEREAHLIDDAKARRQTLGAEIAKLDAEHAAHGAEVAGAVEKLGAAEAEREACEAQLSNVTEAAATARAERAQVETDLQERTAYVSAIEGRVFTLETQIREITGRAPDAAKLQGAQASIQKLSGDATRFESEAIVAEDATQHAADAVEAARASAANAELEAKALEAERATLQRMLAPANGAAGFAPIVDAVTVSPGFEAAFAAALGDDLDAPTDTAAAIHWRSLSPADEDPHLPAAARPISDVVTAPPELSRRLAQTGLVSAAEGAALQRQLAPGQMLVTQDGDVWRWDGYVAAASGATPAAQRLAQRNRLDALGHEARTARETADARTAQYERVFADRQTADAKARTARGAWRDAQNALTGVRDAIAKMERAARETETQLATVTGAKANACEDLLAAKAKLASTTEKLADLPAADAHTAALETARTAAADARAAAAALQANVAHVREAARSRADRLSAATSECAVWEKRSADAEAQVKSLTARQDEAATELATYAEWPQQADATRQRLMSEVAKAEHARQLKADALQTHLNIRVELAAKRKEAQAGVADLREVRARIEAQLEGARTAREDITHRIREALDVAPDACLELAQLEPGALDHLPELAVVEQKLGKLKADRERLGGVNLAADDDLERMAKESGAIEAEFADVEAAITKLRGAISQLNREGRKRLQAAFESVDSHFRHLFVTLFGGGEARLEMVEGDDPLESGLEIIARPPGKKPTTLSLLSGGEQTLTALALIFAVFLTNPSPICVLDEVDAPLDDANVDRFCTMMETMAQDTETRFLVITHHPMTMTRMNRLFGVTMAERGVSQLVSVDLEEAQGFREAG